MTDTTFHILAEYHNPSCGAIDDLTDKIEKGIITSKDTIFLELFFHECTMRKAFEDRWGRLDPDLFNGFINEKEKEEYLNSTHTDIFEAYSTGMITDEQMKRYLNIQEKYTLRTWPEGYGQYGNRVEQYFRLFKSAKQAKIKIFPAERNSDLTPGRWSYETKYTVEESLKMIKNPEIAAREIEMNEQNLIISFFGRRFIDYLKETARRMIYTKILRDEIMVEQMLQISKELDTSNAYLIVGEAHAIYDIYCPDFENINFSASEEDIKKMKEREYKKIYPYINKDGFVADKKIELGIPLLLRNQGYGYDVKYYFDDGRDRGKNKEANNRLAPNEKVLSIDINSTMANLKLQGKEEEPRNYSLKTGANKI